MEEGNNPSRKSNPKKTQYRTKKIIDEDSNSEKEEIKGEIEFLDDSDNETKNSKTKAKELNPYKDKIVKVAGKLNNRQYSVYGFPNREQADNTEIEWQEIVYARFFKIDEKLKKGRQSSDLYEKIKAQIKKYEQPIFLDETYSRRSLIIALSKILSKYKEIPNLSFKIGITQINLVRSAQSKKINQIGNCFMELPDLGFDIAYGNNCEKFILDMLKDYDQYKHCWKNDPNPDRLRKLLSLIQHNLSSFKPFVYENFNEFGQIILDPYNENKFLPSVDKERLKRVNVRIHFLNGLLFLTSIVEVIVRLYRDENEEIFDYPAKKAKISDGIPVGIFQSRSLLLLILGKISFHDFLGESRKFGEDKKSHRALFGAVTGKKIVDNLVIFVQKIIEINDKYNDFISSNNKWGNFKADYSENNEDPCFIAGKSAMASTLKLCFGSGDESDENSSDYSSEEESDTLIYKSK